MTIIYESFYGGNQSNQSLQRRCCDLPAEPEGTAVWPRSGSKLWRPKPTFAAPVPAAADSARRLLA